MDTLLSDIFYLKRFWADIAVGAVSAGSIVIHFYVFEYCLSHFFPCSKSFTMNGLDLEGMKKALGTGIIIAISLTTHTANQSMLVQQFLIGP